MGSADLFIEASRTYDVRGGPQSSRYDARAALHRNGSLPPVTWLSSVPRMPTLVEHIPYFLPTSSGPTMILVGKTWWRATRASRRVSYPSVDIQFCCVAPGADLHARMTTCDLGSIKLDMLELIRRCITYSALRGTLASCSEKAIHEYNILTSL